MKCSSALRSSSFSLEEGSIINDLIQVLQALSLGSAEKVQSQTRHRQREGTLLEQVGARAPRDPARWHTEMQLKSGA